MSTNNSAASSPVPTGVNSANPVASPVATPPISEPTVPVDSYDLDFALDNVLSEEDDERLVEIPQGMDTDMSEAPAFNQSAPPTSIAAPPARGIENNIVLMQTRILELSTSIIQHGSVVPALLITELRSLRSALGELVEVRRLLTPVLPVEPTTTLPASVYPAANRPIVPSQIPFFQWSGNVYDGTRTVYSTLKTVLNKFEDVLLTYQLNLDDHWRRLLPLGLSTEIRAWLSDFTTEQPNANWNSFKDAIIAQYGVTQDAEQEAAASELLALNMSQHQSIESFIDRFQDIKRRSGITDPSILCPRFITALPTSLSDPVTVALATSPRAIKRNLTSIMNVAKDLHEKLNRRTRVAPSAGPSHSNHSRIEKHHSSGRHHRNSAPSSSSSRPPAGPAPVAGSNQIYCTYHKAYGNHVSDDCRALKAANNHYGHVDSGNNTGSAPSGRTCYVCHASWAPGHRCDKGKGRAPVRFYNRSSSSSGSDSRPSSSTSSPASPTEAPLVNRGMQVAAASNSPHRAQRSSTTTSTLRSLTFTDDEDVDMLDDPSKHCKSTKNNTTINNEPSLPKEPHSILLPITIQDHQTWAYLDTGSNFSAIKPSLVETLGLVPVYIDNDDSFSSFSSFSSSSSLTTTIPKNKTTTISLGHKNNSVDRIGFINNVKVFYNNISLHHNFEIFDIQSKADICIGLDLMFKLNITINGLVTHWDDATLPTIEDPIDPKPNAPSYEYYGTESVRKQFMENIEKELIDNANIDPTSVCTIPNSEFRLAVPENTVVFKKQYPLPLANKPDLEEQVKTWLADKTIAVAEPNNPHNNPILFVKKRDENGNYGNIVRVATDCRELNLRLIPSQSDQFVLPRIEEIHEQLSHCSLFTVLDLKSCFTRFGIAKESQALTAFTTHLGQFVFQKCPFGIRTLPSFVQRMISNLFSDLPTVFCYLDDITLGSPTEDVEEHTKLVKEVLQRLNNVGLILQTKKCHYLLTSLTLLGFKLSPKGLQIDSSKICNLDQLPAITNNKALMRVLGFFNFFRRHIHNYSKISAPLDKLRNVSDKALFLKSWNESHDKAYRSLKYAVTHAPVISVMDTTLPLRVSTDASNYGIGGYVWQLDRTNTVRFLGFASRSLTKSEKNYSTNKRECLAIAYLFIRYHQWLHLNKFILYTDHYSLIFLHTQRYCSALLQNWYTTIYSKSFKIVYIKGSDNYMADSLSRLFASPEVELEMEQRISFLQNKRKTNDNASPANDATTTHSGDLTSVDRLLVQRASELADAMTPPPEERRAIIEKYHSLGHYGINAVEKAIHDANLHWTNLRNDIIEVVSECLTCHAFNWSKTGFHPPKQILPTAPGHHAVCDLGTFNITSESGNNFILVYVDLFSRFTILRALPDKEASTIAKQLVDIFTTFGIVKVLQTDRGSEFTNELVEQVLAQLGVDHRLSLAYTPNSNGTNESFVHTTKRTLVKKLQGAKHQWDTLLPATQLEMNLKVSRLHCSTPFSVMFNRRANDFENYTTVDPNFDNSVIKPEDIALQYKKVNEFLIPALSKRIQHTQEKDRARFIKTHKIIEDKFPLNSTVMIKNVSRNGKTDEHYIGPFRIVNYTSNGSYVLMDDANNLLSRDIPTSQIKLVSRGNATSSTSTSGNSDDFYEVQSIVAHKGNNPTNYLYRVRWKGYTVDDDTWEPASHFPDKLHIERYWSRRNSLTTSGTVRLPKTVNARHIPDRTERHDKRKSRRINHSTSPAN